VPRPHPNPSRVGLEDAFQQCKERLLSPELGVKEACLRLGGISTMIFALKNLNDDSVARRFMVAEISRRVREVLGAPPRYESDEDDSGNEDCEALEESAMDCS
jgi:hypothetical protein